jgi:hypothetical protein
LPTITEARWIHSTFFPVWLLTTHYSWESSVTQSSDSSLTPQTPRQLLRVITESLSDTDSDRDSSSSILSTHQSVGVL